MITKEIVEEALQKIKTATDYGYFFNKINSPDWIPLLKEKGFFKKAPDLIKKDNGISCNFWFESQFLAKVANMNSELVCNTILDIEPTDNCRVRSDYCSAACKMPADIAIKIAKQELKYIQNTDFLYFLYPTDIAKLIQYLANNKVDKLPLKLFYELFRVNPIIKDEKGNQYLRKDFTPKFDHYEYGEILNETSAILFKFDSLNTFQTLCNILIHVLDCSNNSIDYDLSYISLPSISDHEQNKLHANDIDSLLITKIRDCGEALLSCGNKDVFSILKKSKYGIFKRLELHFRTNFFSLEPDEANNLINQTDFNNDNSLHNELHHFLVANYSKLDKHSQKHYWDYTQSKMTFEEFDALQNKMGIKKTQKDDWERYLRATEYQRLIPIKKYLMGDELKNYQKLDMEFGKEVEHPEFLSYISSGRVGPTSPLNEVTIFQMEVEELVEFFNVWQPNDDTFTPSPEGLGRVFAKEVKENNSKYTQKALLFTGCEPTYIKSFFGGIKDAIRNDTIIENWDQIFKLALWAVNQKDEDIKVTKQRINFDADYNWRESRNTIASMLGDSLRVREQNNIPFTLRDLIWSIICKLTEDNDPAKEKTYSLDSPGFDEYTTSINTVRGNALHAVFSYSLWVMDNLKKQGTEAVSFKDMKEVQIVLEKHLDIKQDPFLAIRAVYGKWYPWILVLDDVWAKDNVAKIFPKETENIVYFNAAWRAFCYNNYYSTVFKTMQDEYLYAINKWQKTKHTNNKVDILIKKILEHIAIAYLRNEIEYSDDLLQNALSINEDAAYQIMHFFGRYLFYELKDTKLDANHEKLLIAYFEQRIKNKPFSKELSAFELWFMSTKFNSKWAIEHFEDVLIKVDDFESTQDLVTCFKYYVDEFPLNVIRCIKKIISKNKRRMFWYDYKGDLKSILQNLLQVKNEDVINKTKDLIHLFGARGNQSFRELLK